MVVWGTVAQAFDRLYHFKRASDSYIKALCIKALWTGQKLCYLSDDIAALTVEQLAGYAV